MVSSSNIGMEAQNLTDQQPSESVQRILKDHNEALVIVADPSEDCEGESKIAVFTKLLGDDGVLAPVLADILRNLLATIDGKQRSGISDKTSIGA